ncbi:DUF3179 domain-containing (seleno)protein [Portibacter lacus]|uniref:Uncharacterized protein n=1 Tax=Portibacter lacus TaxID=1099794 RepID=A0AA37STQ5_9BACT|nr:DUF3179 domain-containing (seleno)protein [Portibacter lacus]GLR19429.1 hypothetical protein GCM10007940_40450 [Portibacter lacus]
MCRLLTILIIIIVTFSCSKEELPLSCTDENPCESKSINVLNLVLGGEPIVLIYSEALAFYQSFSRRSENQVELKFEAVQKSFPIIMKDQFGVFYDVFGEVAANPNFDSGLETIHAGVGFWFVWSSIYPQLVFNDEAGDGEVLELNDSEWEVNTNYINQGASLDAIPAINSPKFKPFTNKDIFTSSFLNDRDEIIVVKIGETTKVYPIKILNYHEIVNDTINGFAYAVCYAPYTNTATVWERTINNLTLEFGVSGRIYNNNILLFDRTTTSFWNQLLEIAVNGPFQKTKIERVSYLRTTWSTWRETANTHYILIGEDNMGFDYSVDPLGDYSTNQNYLPFPISNDDDRLDSKDEVYGIEKNGEVFAFQFF